MSQRLDDLQTSADFLLRTMFAPLAERIAADIERQAYRRDGTIDRTKIPLLRLRVIGALNETFGASRTGQAAVRDLLEGAMQTAYSYAALAAGATLPTLPVVDWNARDDDGRSLAQRLEVARSDMETRVLRLIDEHARKKTPAATVATELRQFLTPDGLPDVVSRDAGSNGLASIRRIVRTETSAAYGAGALDHADYVRWVLSPVHAGLDTCDANARRDAYGRGSGVYPSDDAPRYPDHPYCRCSLEPVIVVA